MQEQIKDMSGEKTPETNLPDLAREYALGKVGPQPGDSAGFMEVSSYWDKYWAAYYSYCDGQIHDELGLESGEPEDDDDYWNDTMELGGDTDNNSGQDEILSSLRALIDLLEGKSPSPSNQVTKEKEVFFRYPEARKEVFEFSKAIAEHLHETGTKDLVIVDRSSRPLYIGVKEYWHDKWPEERLPGIYFVNPKGFKSKELSSYELEEANLDATWKGDRNESISQARSKNVILEEFKEVYPRLMADKDEKILIFDTCIHSGDSLYYSVEAMRELGFSKLEIGSVNQSDDGAKVKSDFWITDERPENGCYPFDRDRVIEKTFDHVYSKRVEDKTKRAAGQALRQEIKGIMTEYLDKERI